MRFVFIGTSSLSRAAARLLIGRGHEVVMIERVKGVIDALSGELDCGFLLGDGSTPSILREAGPAETDILFCLTSNDRTNIIASLVGRSLGYAQVVTRIEDEEFEHICMELGLSNFIVPARAIGRHLADFAEGQNVAELSSMIKGDARLFSFIAAEGDAGKPVHDMGLPEQSRIISLYRGGEFVWPGRDVVVQPGDEVVVISHSSQLERLHERWGKGHAGRHVSRKRAAGASLF